jgi:hypothetical protein
MYTEAIKSAFDLNHFPIPCILNITHISYKLSSNEKDTSLCENVKLVIYCLYVISSRVVKECKEHNVALRMLY